MKAVVVILAVAAVASASPHRWELVPSRDGGLELYDLRSPPPEVRVNADDVVFQLYTRSNPTSPQVLTTGSSYTGNFVASKQIRFITHGWMNEGDHMSDIRDAWLSAGDYNVIVIDWSVHAGNWNYAQAKAAVAGVGELSAAFINWLVSLGASTGNIQIAGHSLGAHVCGVTGNRLTSGRLARITGMDPAAPLFGSESTANRLDASDANFVQVIHSNGGVLGWNDPMGTADFYPNGGKSQPGCGIDLTGSCSHGRSTEFFAESITTSRGFRGNQCSSWNDYNGGKCSSNPSALMGETVSTSASGSYYLATASSPPYALG